MKRRVFVVEDHQLMRQSIVEALERDSSLTVCGEAEDAPAALAAISSLQPDVVLTDIQLKSSSGVDLIKTLHEQSPEIPVLATTMFDAHRAERQARAAGACGFVAKQEGPDQLIAIIHQVLRTNGDNRNFGQTSSFAPMQREDQTNQ